MTEAERLAAMADELDRIMGRHPRGSALYYALSHCWMALHDAAAESRRPAMIEVRRQDCPRLPNGEF
jgi:hypothetical protein